MICEEIIDVPIKEPEMIDMPVPKSYDHWEKDKDSTDLILANLNNNQRPLLVGTLREVDKRLSYDFVSFDKIVEEDKTGEVPIMCIDGRKIDYPIEIDPKIEGIGKVAFMTDKENVVPISFLSIKEGDVERGKEWYLRNDPKLPDDIAELMARYSWGDLKDMTKKDAKNKRKKLSKKGKNILDDNKLEVKKGSFKIAFD